jgi:inosine/xanthosine triphosphatase
MSEPLSFPPALTALRLAVVGSLNPVKLAAVRGVLQRVSPGVEVRAVAVPSGVPDQPWGDAETIRGARTRALGALAAVEGATLAVGLEGGVVEVADGAVRTCAWAVAVARDGTEGVGGSLSMPLPPAVVARLRRGEELGLAMDAEAQVSGTKTGRGAVGLLTAGLVDRQAAYEPLVAYALAPLLAPAFWQR